MALTIKLILRESEGIVRVLGMNETEKAVATEIEYGFVELLRFFSLYNKLVTR